MGRISSNQRIRVEEFDYSSLSTIDKCKVRKRARAIRRRIDNRTLISTARNVVKVGRWLLTVRRCLGCHDFQRWCTAVFKWKQPRVSKFMRSALAFRLVDCLDRFDPTALYVLSTKFAEAARGEAVQRALAGEHITTTLAEAIVDRHRGLPQTVNDFRRIGNALRKLAARLEQLGPTETSVLMDQLERLRRDWQHFEGFLPESVSKGGDRGRLPGPAKLSSGSVHQAGETISAE